MDEDLTVKSFRKWDDVKLEVDGTVTELTRVRFWLGKHGPFEKAFPRGASDSDVGAAIERERSSLRTLGTY